MLVILILTIASYALWNYSFLGIGNDISRDEIVVEFLESSNKSLGVTNSIPISDTEGMAQEETYDFQVSTKTKNEMAIGYKLSIKKLEASPGYTNLDDSMIKVYLTDYDDNVVVPPTLVSDLDNYVLYEHLNSHDEENSLYKDKYKIRIWIDGDVTGEDLGTEEDYQYNFEIDVDFIEKQTTNSVSDLAVSLLNAKYTYDGSAKTPEVLVKDRSKVLVEGTDYTVTYSDNINAGVASAVITGKGDYTGTVTKKFIIGKAESVCAISSVPSLEYPTSTTGNIVYSCTGDGEVNAVSSDENLIEVGEITDTNVKITALKNGEGTITLKQAEGSNYKKSNEVTKDISVGLSTYTVNVTIQNGSVDTASKSIKYGANGSFTISASTGYGSPVVTCTNDQTGTISNSTLTVSNVTKDTTCTVTYKANTYTVTLNGNGATTNGTTSVTATYNSSSISPSTITLPKRAYTVSGFNANSTGASISSTSTLTSTYTFNGWYTGASGGSKVISNSTTPAYVASVSGYTDANSKWIKAGTATLYAQWSSASVTLPTVTKTGYTCEWNTVSNGSGTTYNSGATITPSANISALYAVCTAHTYTVEYYSYDGETKYGNSSYTYDAAKSLTAIGSLSNVTTPTGKTFYGWATSANSTTKAYSDGESVSNLTNANGGIVKLYAIWQATAKTYTATTAKNVSSATGSNTTAQCTIPAVYNGTTQDTSCQITLPANPYTLTSWTFNGWVNGGSSTTTTTQSGTAASQKMSISGNVNIVATWKKTSTATFYYYDGSSQKTKDATCTMYNGGTSCSYSLPSEVSSSSGPSSTTYKGVSTSASSSTTTTSYTSANSNYYAVYTKAVTATFYYNSNTTSGSLTVSTATANGTRISTTNGTTYSISEGSITVPSSVTGSVGKYNSTYKGVSTSLSSMASSSVTTANTTYYANYSKAVTIYYPTSTSAVSSGTFYRNEYFTSTSATSQVIGSSNTATSNITTISGILGTFKGLATSANTSSYSSVATSAGSATTTFYAVSTSSVEATFYYNSNTTSGSLTVSTAKASGTRTNYCSSTSAATVSHGSITVPSAVTGSVGQYNNAYVGIATGVNTMSSSASSTTANTTYYAVYRTNVTIYRPTSTTAASSITAYRNSYFTSTSAMSNVLGTSTTSTSTMTAVSGIYGTLKGFGSVNTSTVTYSSIDALLKTNTTSIYAISTSTITISYDANGGSGAPSSHSTTRTTYCTSTSAATTTGNTTISSTKPTKTGYTFSKWNTSSDGSGTNYSSGTSYSIAASTKLYAIYTINKYTVNVVVQNGTVDTASKTIEYNKSGTFNLTNNEGSDYTSVSCTNSQTASVSGGVLTVSNVTNNTTCTVVYTERTYTVTYAVGSDSTATGLPATQTKRYTKALTLSSTEPTSETNEFLGWSKTSTATESDTWYDPENEYTTNENMTLYAQWYDVDTLETEYTGFSRSGDFVSKSRSISPGSVAAWATGSNTTSNATSGYKGLGVVSFASSASGISLFAVKDIDSVNQYSYNYINAYSSALTPTFTMKNLQLLERTGSVSDGSVDDRILNIQNVKEACLSISNDDVYVRHLTTGDFSVSAKSPASKSVSSTLDGYTLMGNVGFYVSTADTNGANISMVFLYGVTGNTIYVRNPYSNAANVKAMINQLFIRDKSVETATVPNYGEYPTLGQKRLGALTALKNATSDYFDYNDVKVSSVSETGVSTSSSTTQYLWNSSLSAQRRIVGVTGYIAWNNGGTGSLYATTKSAYVDTVNSTTGSIVGKFGRLYRQSNSTSYYSTGITHTIYYLYIE